MCDALVRLSDSWCGCVAQTKEDIASIVQQAQTPPMGPSGWEQDEYIDDAMDAVEGEGGYDEWCAFNLDCATY